MGFIESPVELKDVYQGGLIDIGKKDIVRKDIQKTYTTTSTNTITYSPSENLQYNPNYNYSPQYIIGSAGAEVSSFFESTPTQTPTQTITPTVTPTVAVSPTQDTTKKISSGGSIMEQITDNVFGIGLLVGGGYLAYKLIFKKK